MSGEGDETDAVLAEWQRVRVHPFRRRSGWSDGGGKYNDCFECQADEDDPIHGEALTPPHVNRYVIHQLFGSWSPATTRYLAELAAKALRA